MSNPDSCRHGLNGAGVEVHAFLIVECFIFNPFKKGTNIFPMSFINHLKEMDAAC
jgi:hypothetical protein